MRLLVSNTDTIASIEVLEYQPKDYKKLVSVINTAFTNAFTVIYQTLSKNGDSYIIFGLHGGKLSTPSLELFDDCLWKHRLEIKDT